MSKTTIQRRNSYRMEFHCQMFIAECPLPNVHCQMFIAKCPLLNVHCHMSIAECHNQRYRYWADNSASVTRLGRYTTCVSCRDPVRWCDRRQLSPALQESHRSCPVSILQRSQTINAAKHAAKHAAKQLMQPNE